MSQASGEEMKAGVRVLLLKDGVGGGCLFSKGKTDKE